MVERGMRNRLTGAGRSLTIAMVLLAGVSAHLHAEPFDSEPAIPSILTDQPEPVGEFTVGIPPSLPEDQPSLPEPMVAEAGMPTADAWDGATFSCATGGCPDGTGGAAAGNACGAWCGGCGRCGHGGCGNACIDGPGLLQFFQKCHARGNACWIGRTDALFLFRDAPPDRPLVEAGSGLPFLNANQMNSPVAAGPRFSLFRFDRCNGTGIEATYLRAANWRSQRDLPVQYSPYALSPPGIYGNSNFYNFDSGSANLGAALQSFELNRHWCHGEHLRFLTGFRWVEWRESFSLADSFTSPTESIQDFYQTDCTNSLYGGQIGLDAWLLTLPWMRVDSVIKAGAYYNNAVQSSLFQSNTTGSLLSQRVTVNESPLNCAFVGELGVTGVVPLAGWLDLRVGYFGMWLSGIAQPTQQLSGQVLTRPAGVDQPSVGTINANGTTLVQGVTLGLEGRW